MKTKKWIIVLLLLLLVMLLVGAALLTNREDVEIENAGQAVHVEPEQISLMYQGQEYLLKEKLRTILLIGTDNVERYEKKENLLQDYYNYNQADFLVLLVQDTLAGTTEVIQLNRDTMMEVPHLDVIGNYAGTRFEQICLAFNSGDGGRKSCLNTVDAVSSLLFDAPIAHYIQIPMTAVPVLNNLVGGVPVQITADLTMVDPAFVMGSTIHLTGDQAERFVRARLGLEDDTNLSRMARQRIYLDSFQKQAQKKLNSDSEFLMKVLEKAEDFLQTDMTAQQLSDMLTTLETSQISPIRTADGELLLGEEHYEFFVDEASLWEIVKRAYCQE